MSLKEFSKSMRNTIHRSLELTKRYAKSDMRDKSASGLHVMEINYQTLMNGFTITEDEARKLYKKTAVVVKRTTKTFTSELAYKSNKGIHSKIYSNSILLLAPSYNSLKVYLKKYIKNNSKLKGLKSFDIGHTIDVNDPKRSAIAAARLNQASKAALLNLSLANNLDAIKITKRIESDFLKKYEKEHLAYTATFDKDISLAKSKAFGRLKFVLTVPQSSKINGYLGQIERRLLNEFRNYVFEAEASKSIKRALSEQIIERFESGTNKRSYKSKTKTSGKIKEDRKKPKVTVYSVDKPKQLRDKAGRFTSIANLQALLEPLVKKYVKADMDSASYFKTDTNTFAPSVGIDTIQNTTDGIIVNYNYQTDPYEIYEKNASRLHKAGREPSTIISESIRQAAKSLISKAFNIVPRNINE